MSESEFNELEPVAGQPEDESVTEDTQQLTQPVSTEPDIDVEEVSDEEQEPEAESFEDMEVEESTEPVETVKEPGKLNLFLKKLLRWSTGIATVFVLGIAAAWFVRVRPLQSQLTDTSASLEAAQQEVETLQDSVSDLQEQRDSLESEKRNLEDLLTTAVADQRILQALADVSAARVALAEDDVVTAKAALSGTEEKLQSLLDILPSDVGETVQGMISRLTLVLDEIDEDVFAAENDLEVLWTNLQALESSLFQ